MYESEAEGK